MASGRALHFVFKVADRTATAKFYREILGMKVSVVVRNKVQKYRVLRVLVETTSRDTFHALRLFATKSSKRDARPPVMGQSYLPQYIS